MGQTEQVRYGRGRPRKGEVRLPKPKPQKPTEPRICECGVELHPFKDSGLGLHYASVIHTKGKRIRALLEQNCMTYEEIGKRVGVTRQRVHQIAQNLEGVLDGKTRQSLCSLSKAVNHVLVDDTMKAAKTICENLGYGFEFVPSPNQKGKHSLLHTKVKINGYLCTLQNFGVRYEQNAFVWGGKYQDRDFGLFYCEKINTWLIIPQSHIHPRQVTFNLTSNNNRMGRKDIDAHGYRAFINAWHLLEASQ